MLNYLRFTVISIITLFLFFSIVICSEYFLSDSIIIGPIHVIEHITFFFIPEIVLVIYFLKYENSIKT